MGFDTRLGAAAVARISLGGPPAMRQFLCAALFLTACGPVEDDSDDMVTTDAALTGNVPVGSTLKTTGNVNLRSRPDTTYAVKTVVTSGAMVTTINQASPTGRFYNVSFNGQEGWVSGLYLQFVSGPTNGMPTDMGQTF